MVVVHNFSHTLAISNIKQFKGSGLCHFILCISNIRCYYPVMSISVSKPLHQFRSDLAQCPCNQDCFHVCTPIMLLDFCATSEYEAPCRSSHKWPVPDPEVLANEQLSAYYARALSLWAQSERQ